MRLSNFRIPAVLAGLAFFAVTAAVPTLAKQPTRLEAAKPLLMAQESTAAQESAVAGESAVAEDAASDDATILNGGAGAAARDAIRTFLDSKPAGSTLNLSLPVKDFIYHNGGVGDPKGSTNKNIFNSYFKTEYGVLGAASDYVLTGPLTARATSGFSPKLTQQDLNKLKSVTLKFDYAFKSRPGDALDLIIRNVTTGETTFDKSLSPSSGQSVTLDITKYFTKPGQYAVRFKFVKLGRTNDDAAGFNNVNLTITQK